MVRHNCCAVVVALLIVGCKDMGPVSESNGSSDIPKVGQLLIDVYSIACTAKVNPRNDSLQAYFPMTLGYHFEGGPGSVSLIAVEFGENLRVHTNIDGPFPDSIEAPVTITQGFWTNTQLAQLDSVVVRCRLRGEYCGRIDGEPRVIGTFEWKDERKIPVNK
jgi:hypothetical protein